MDAIREKLEACFIYLSYASPHIRRLAGVAKLSQVWIDVPSWYLWLEGDSGAYMLECSGAGEVSLEGAPSRAGVFCIRYFPPLTDLRACTDDERVLRESPVFDDTGTPAFEQVHLIRNSNTFAVAEFTAIFPAAGGVVFHLEELPKRPEQAMPLFDALVRMHSYYLRTAPADWTKGNGWHFISFPPALHPEGGEPKKPLDTWRKLASIEPESEATSLCGCCH